MKAIKRVLAKAKVRDWLKVEIVEHVHEEKTQIGPGRPGPDTQYTTGTHKSYTIRVAENKEALALVAHCDGIFPLMTNDDLSLKQALKKYKIPALRGEETRADEECISGNAPVAEEQRA